MARLLKLFRMLALNVDLARTQLRSDLRFVCLSAFGVVIGTAVLAAAMGIATLAEGRLLAIKEEIGTQMVYLTIASKNAADFKRQKGRPVDQQALSALAAKAGTFSRYAAFLRSTVLLDDMGTRGRAVIIGFEPSDLYRLPIALASGARGEPDGCYLDAASVPLVRARTLQLENSRCVLDGTFWRTGLLSSVLSGEPGAVVLTSFAQAYSVLGQKDVPPSFVVAFRLNSEADAFAALAAIGDFMQQNYAGLPFSLEWPGSRLMSLNKLLDQLRLVAVLVGGLIMLISAVAMASAMLAQIGQRRREFGIRLAIGAKPRDLILQTLFEVLGIFGGGTLVGFCIAVTIMYLWCEFSGWRFALSPSLFLISVGVTFFCAICSGLYPAFKAAGIEPIEAMQDS